MANPNRVLAYVAKGESVYVIFPCVAQAARCADHFRELGYKVRETRFKIGPRQNYRWQYRVSVYYNSDAQNIPDPEKWKRENLA